MCRAPEAPLHGTFSHRRVAGRVIPGPCGPAGHVPRRRPIVNLVHHLHREQWQIIFPGRVGRFGWWLEARAAPWLYRRHPYVTVSLASMQDLVALGVDADRISIVHNGVDVAHPAVPP